MPIIAATERDTVSVLGIRTLDSLVDMIQQLINELA